MYCANLQSRFLLLSPAVAKEEKEIFRGHPEPQQRTSSSALLLRCKFLWLVLVGSKVRQRTASSALLLSSLTAAMVVKGVFGEDTEFWYRTSCSPLLVI